GGQFVLNTQAGQAFMRDLGRRVDRHRRELLLHQEPGGIRLTGCLDTSLHFLALVSTGYVLVGMGHDIRLVTRSTSSTVVRPARALINPSRNISRYPS